MLVTPDKRVGSVDREGFSVWEGEIFQADKIRDYLAHMNFALEGYRVPSNNSVSRPAMLLEGYIIV